MIRSREWLVYELKMSDGTTEVHLYPADMDQDASAHLVQLFIDEREQYGAQYGEPTVTRTARAVRTVRTFRDGCLSLTQP